MPALEALACGAPLVTTAGTPMAELAGDSALLVPGHEPHALAEAVETAIAGESRGGRAASRAGSFGRRLVHLGSLCRGAYGGVPHALLET